MSARGMSRLSKRLPLCFQPTETRPTPCCAVTPQECAMRLPCQSMAAGIQGAVTGLRLRHLTGPKIIILGYPVLLTLDYCFDLVLSCLRIRAISVLFILGLDICHATCRVLHVSSQSAFHHGRRNCIRHSRHIKTFRDDINVQHERPNRHHNHSIVNLCFRLFIHPRLCPSQERSVEA
jgi:hypothetical protein